MKATAPFLLLFALLLAGSTSIAPGDQSQASTDSAAIRKLDEILDRLKAIEDRLERIEATLVKSTSWEVDSFGILRDRDGRPMGYWGVDFPPAATAVTE